MSATAIRAGRAFVEVFADDSKLDKVLAKAQRKLEAWGSGVAAAGGALVGMGAGLAAPFIAATKVWSEMGSELKDMSDRTGITVENLSALTYAAGQSGASAGDLEVGIKKMQATLADAAAGSSEANSKLARLGITFGMLERLTPDEQLSIFADALDRIPDPATRTAMALDIFGKAGTKLLPLMKGGASAIKEMTDRAKALGLVMTGAEAAAAESFGDQIATVGETVKRVAFVVGAALGPVVSELADRITNAIAATAAWIRANAGVVRLAAVVVAGIVAVGLALLAVGGVIYTVGAAIGVLSTVLFAIPTLIGLISSAFAGAFAAIAAAFGFVLSPLGLFMAAVIAAGYYLLDFKAIAGAVGSYAAGVFAALKTDAVNAFGAIAAALAAGNIQSAAAVLWAYLRLLWIEGTAWIAGLWEQFLDGLVATLEGYGAMFANAWNTLVASLQSAWEMFLLGFTVVFGGAVGGAMAYAMILWQFLEAFAAGAGAALQSVGGHLYNWFTVVYNFIASGLRGLVNVVFGIVNAVSLAFGGAFAGLTKSINDMHEAATAALGDIKPNANTTNPLEQFGNAYAAKPVKSVGENFAAVAGDNFIGAAVARAQTNVGGIAADLKAKQDAQAAALASNDAARTNARFARDDARAAGVDAARAAFEASLADAKKASATSNKTADIAAAAAGSSAAGGAKFSASGTFSAAAAAMLGAGGSVAERTAVATETTAKSVRRIEQNGVAAFT